MPTQPRERVAVAIVAATALVVLVVLLARGGAGADDPVSPDAPDAAQADVVPYDGRSPRQVEGEHVRVLIALRRPALGALPRAAEMEARLQRRHVASLEREGRALRSGLEARDVQLRDVVTFQRVWNGFAATVDEADLRELTEGGLRAIPVRRFYPALSEPVPLGGGAPRRRPGHPGTVAVIGGERTASVLAQVAGAPARVVPIGPVGPLEDEHALTDELLAGLEKAVDPNLDGVTDDKAAVALVAVNAPFAGFSGAPEARAAAAARRLGTTVVAPAGHEGGEGTIGSPGGAPAAVTVSSLTAAEAVPRMGVEFGGTEWPAAALGGEVPRRVAAGPLVEAEDPADLLQPDAPRLQGRLALVRAGVNPPAQAAAAEAAGASAVLLAETRDGRSLPAMPAGRLRVPVAGVTGEAAEAALRLAPGTQVVFGRPAVTEDGDPEQAGLSRFSSTGPSPSGALKPNQAAQAWADVDLDGSRARVAGSAVAAARVASALAGGPRPRVLRGEAAGAFKPGEPRPAELGEIALTREDGRLSAVRFTVGAFGRGDPPAARPARLAIVQRLELTITRTTGRRRPVRRLTPAGGATDLLPGEYAYALPRAVLRGLRKGSYAFQASAWAPRQSRPTVRRSEPFTP